VARWYKGRSAKRDIIDVYNRSMSACCFFFSWKLGIFSTYSTSSRDLDMSLATPCLTGPCSGPMFILSPSSVDTLQI